MPRKKVDMPQPVKGIIPPALPLDRQATKDWIIDGILPPTVRETVQNNCMPWQTIEQEIEYTYKVHKNLTIIFHGPEESLKAKLQATYRTVWYLRENDLINTFSNRNYQCTTPPEATLKNIILNEVWLEPSQEEMEKLASIPELKGIEGKKGRMLRLGNHIFKPLQEYLQGIMSDNILHFIQHVSVNSLNTSLGTITRDGNDIRYEVIFHYEFDSPNVFGKYYFEKPSPEKPVHTISPFTNNEIIPIATGAPVSTSTMVLMRSDLWGNDENHLPKYTKKTDGGIIEHFINAPDSLDEEQKVQWLKENAWSVVDDYDLETAYMNLIYSACAMALPKPWDGEIKIIGSDIIKLLGWDKKRKHMKKGALLNEVFIKARNACTFGTGGYWKVGKKGFEIERGAHWVFMGEKWAGQLTFEGKPDNPTELYIIIRPGLWTKHFMNREGQAEGTALHQFAHIAKQTLQISTAQEPIAAKLALYLITTLRDREKNFKVETLLKAILPDGEFNQALTVKEKTHALKTQWDNALLRLKDIGWGIRFDSSYPPELIPEWAKNTNEPVKPVKSRLPKNYINDLLEAKVWFTAPAIVKGLIKAPETKKNQNGLTRLTGIEIKNAREKMNLSARKLSCLMGHSSAWITQIENGNRPITKENEKELRKILKI